MLVSCRPGKSPSWLRMAGLTEPRMAARLAGKHNIDLTKCKVSSDCARCPFTGSPQAMNLGMGLASAQNLVTLAGIWRRERTWHISWSFLSQASKQLHVRPHRLTRGPPAGATIQ